MEVYRPRKATAEELGQFHSPEYVEFLQRVTPDHSNDFKKQMERHNVGKSGGDCPLFDGLYEFCQTYCGGSIDGAKRLIAGSADICINWAGGLHHAKKGEASGFCYTNDIVLSILELLKYFPRVLYIDIDVHHGDGVEEAFYITDRVMTASFHQFGGGFFPGTGDVWDKGFGAGEYFAVNCPLKGGMDDESFEAIFKPVIQKILECFRPSAIVLQCGADSLAGDRLGGFNLTIHGHAKCVNFVKKFGVPTLVLGGGGYNIRNVARCWAYETSVLLDVKVDNRIPYNDYWEYFGPNFSLEIEKLNITNNNPPEYLLKLREKVLDNIRRLTGAPSIQMQEVPSTYYPSDDDDEFDSDAYLDRPEAQGEFYDDDRDQGMQSTDNYVPV